MKAMKRLNNYNVIAYTKLRLIGNSDGFNLKLNAKSRHSAMACNVWFMLNGSFFLVVGNALLFYQ